MAREIKFRGWYTNALGSYMLSPEFHGPINEIFNDPENKGRVVYTQYTGLKDKNGREIYEGDVMPVNGRNYVVVYNEEYARYCLQTASGRMFIPSKNSEVIGNIYENPELLEVRDGKGES